MTALNLVFGVTYNTTSSNWNGNFTGVNDGIYTIDPNVLNQVSYGIGQFNMGPLDVSTLTFPDFESAASYYFSQTSASAISTINSTLGFTLFTSANLVKYPKDLDDVLAAKVETSRTINGHNLTADVTVTKSDIGLSNVDNTADSAKSFTASQVTDFSTAADARITAQKGNANGLVPLDSGSKISATYLPNTVMEYQGNWDPSTNIPALVDGTGNTGDVYRASVAATRNIGSGNQTWAIGDLVIYNGSIWQHSPAADGVSSVMGRTGAVTAQSGDYNLDQVSDGATNKGYTATEKTKLAGISAGATANDLKVYAGTALKANPILYTSMGTVSGGSVVFNLTNDGLSTGTPLFPNGPIVGSLNAFVSDAAASYQMAATWSNSNKTVTITANKLTTSNILTGVLGQAAANSAVVYMNVWGN